jgi:inosose dehydratase
VPLEPKLVASSLKQNGLFIVAGTIFDDLVTTSNRKNLLRQTSDICELVTSLPCPDLLPDQKFSAPYLTVMDWGHDERDFAAGHCDQAPRLNDVQWQGMIENIKAIADLAKTRFGVRAVIHPHAGGYIEFSDEIAHLVEDISPDVAGLCIDTGHTYYAGMDPVETFREYSDRIEYIHFKDINAAVFARVMGERIRFFEACAQGVMCPIGRGVIDYPAIRRFLDRSGYSGYITVEQERDPRNAGGSLSDVKASRDYLASVGF